MNELAYTTEDSQRNNERYSQGGKRMIRTFAKDEVY